jgi:hypothetical protein
MVLIASKLRPGIGSAIKSVRPSSDPKKEATMAGRNELSDGEPKICHAVLDSIGSGRYRSR